MLDRYVSYVLGIFDVFVVYAVWWYGEYSMMMKTVMWMKMILIKILVLLKATTRVIMNMLEYVLTRVMSTMFDS